MPQALSVGLWFGRYAGGGIIAYATPRLLVALGVPLDQWIIAVSYRQILVTSGIRRRRFELAI